MRKALSRLRNLTAGAAQLLGRNLHFAKAARHGLDQAVEPLGQPLEEGVFAFQVHARREVARHGTFHELGNLPLRLFLLGHVQPLSHRALLNALGVQDGAHRAAQ